MNESAKVLSMTETTEIENETRRDVAVYVAPIQGFLVVSDETMQKAGDTLKEIQARIKAIDEKFKPVMTATVEAKRKATEAKSALDDLIEEIRQPLVDVKTYLVSQSTKYDREQKAIREENDKIAREKAQKDEEERRLLEAEQAEKEGDIETAQAIIEEETFIPPPPTKAAYVVDKRIVRNPVWKGRVTDIVKLCVHISRNPQDRNLISPNGRAINDRAKSMRCASSIPGVEFYQE